MRSYCTAKGFCIGLALALAAVGLIALGFVFAQPWWEYTKPVQPVLAALQAISLLLAPLLFVIGMAGYGSVANNFQQAISELQAVTAVLHSQTDSVIQMQ